MEREWYLVECLVVGPVHGHPSANQQVAGGAELGQVAVGNAAALGGSIGLCSHPLSDGYELRGPLVLQHRPTCSQWL